MGASLPSGGKIKGALVEPLWVVVMGLHFGNAVPAVFFPAIVGDFFPSFVECDGISVHVVLLKKYYD
ncbi:MAG: hypothetical protein UW27_C0017G0083 [Parcubacteria group bacterium GW2011_GWA1_44_13]|uniref:Uncharacterized protein n=1 Tax=Candidatus Nomurabacteria bacterium GW2011_GWB1_44_12 TaxID=1618748 RepID=A0A837I7J8_9BACT|nr:MAG: hypothetical protein UW25_C0004G0087 [Candidatus Nomurabacteria bacterium GW2011_GWB1_44_12]KKT37466.1 MAG: hypothetical protein UW27_C0017G0083 [Parcubacteria group bacterium GW2011_GWA1_44_13]